MRVRGGGGVILESCSSIHSRIMLIYLLRGNCENLCFTRFFYSVFLFFHFIIDMGSALPLPMPLPESAGSRVRGAPGIACVYPSP